MPQRGPDPNNLISLAIFIVAAAATFIAPETDKQQTVVLETAQPEQDKFEPAAAAPPSDEPGLNELIKRTELFS